MQRLAAPATDLAHHRVKHRGERDADGHEDRTQGSRRSAGDQRDDAEPADDEREDTEHERHYCQRTRASVEDENPTAVVGDDEAARVGENLRLGWCGHA